tara:strand:- start:5609 stop:6229 length:621 start_codon:yes stop_codon:yes gene_type:complete
MRKIATLLFLVLTSIAYSQDKTSALDKVAKETCEYLNKDEVKSLNNSEKTMKLGVFIITIYGKYKDELEKEGVFFDISKGEKGGRDFGEKVGMNMVKFCPDALMALAGKDDFNEVEVDEMVEVGKFVEGKILSIKGEEVNTLTIKDVSGKTQKFLWLENFKGSDKLIETRKVKNIKVKVSYKNIEVYSPKLKEYIVRKQVTEIEYL